jgi:two-component system CheB/CheR fusion protein
MNHDSPATTPRNQPELERSHLSFPVVGLGASAGGLEALMQFFSATSPTSGMAYVVVLHLSPEHESTADQILQRNTTMPVIQVKERTPIEVDHVYVISPSLHLTMNDGHLNVEPADRPRERQVAVDLLFRDMADVHRERAFGVILSGTGSDGALGLERVKEQGGIAIAQDPEEAMFDGMPRAAVDTGAVDFVLPIAEIPGKIASIWSTASTIEMPRTEDGPTNVSPARSFERAEAAEIALREILLLLRHRTGNDFKHYKRGTILRRIERRMQVNGVTDMPAYRDFLQSSADEAAALLKDMLIGVTNFFRDFESFAALDNEVVWRLMGANAEGSDGVLRVWSAGCSSGEEAYSLAMLLSDAMDTTQGMGTVQVFATDIDERAIATARSGIYPESILVDVSSDRLNRYFTKHQNHFRVKKELRDKVLFAVHNILRDPPFSRLHLISCRNLLIYLDRDAQRDILQTFHFALMPGGYLFLGGSESAEAVDELFVTVDKKHRIYRAKPVASSVRAPISDATPSAYPRLPQVASEVSLASSGKVMYAEVHRRVLEQYAPPSVIVNHNSDIVHMSDQAGRFLRYVGGEPSHNLLSLVHPELRLELRTALFQAVQSNKSVEARRVRLQRNDRNYFVNMVAKPFRDHQADADFVLVLFDEVEESMSQESGTTIEGKDSVLTQLENELQRLKDQLQDTIEHSETSTEELKASNEELQAINEELRSATEELETSKEELQSINEELITVNFELKTKVEETAKINDDLQNLISSSEIATVFVDRAMRVKWYTPRAADLFNLIASDAGRSLMDITHRLDYPTLADDAAETFTSLRMIENEVPSTDGAWFLARLVPYRTAEDRIEGAVLTFIDITQRKRAEERLRAGQERMRLVADSTTDYAIITMDEQGLITGWNRGAELIFGYRAAEVEGQSGAIIFTPEDREQGVPAAELERARRFGHASDDRWHVRKDGSRFYCSGVVHPMVDGNLQGYAKIARDLTDRKIQENAQDAALERTSATNELKDLFFAVMSHELRHPLNLIQLNVDILSRTPGMVTSAVGRKAVETVRRSVRNQSKIIDDLLDMSRVSTGKLKLNRGRLNLVQVVQGCIETVAAQASAGSVQIKVSLPEDPVIVDADATRSEQVVWNLLSNAVKFTPEGGTVTVTLKTEGGNARLDVTDTGIGMAPDAVEAVFDMFNQIDRQHSNRNKSGLGIGLALARQLAEAHGGRVTAYSEGEGKGATFTLLLPLADGASPAEQPEDAPAPHGQLRGARILLVDDSPDVLETMGMLLELEGATVTSAPSGAAALTVAAGQAFDLIISDIAMPEMDGLQLIKKLREMPPLADVPAVALTGYGGTAIISSVRTAGFSDYLCKPVPMDQLIEKVSNVLPARDVEG